MTILVPETQLTQEFTVNIPNMTVSGLVFVLTSQYSHKPLDIVVAVHNLWISRPGVTPCRRRRPGLRRTDLSTPLHPLYQNPN